MACNRQECNVGMHMQWSTVHSAAADLQGACVRTRESVSAAAMF